MIRKSSHREISEITFEISGIKMILLVVIMIILCSLLVYRLFFLQITKKEHYVALSENNYVRTQFLDAPRGSIFDRNGIVLAEDIPSFHVLINNQQWIHHPLLNSLSHQEEDSITLISKILSIDTPLVKEKIMDSIKSQSDVILKSNLNDKEYALFNENLDNIAGFYIKRGFKRFYPQGNVLSHVLGYTRLMEKEKDQEFVNQNPALNFNDRVGKMGIERYYENLLQGEKGSILQKIDALGAVLNEAEIKSIRKGNDLYLTVDIVLQKKAESLIKGHIGTLLLMDCKSGEILACASYPDFDPNIFSDLLSEKAYNELQEKRAEFNIAIQGKYPPGSIFKPLVSLFGLQNGIIKENDSLDCQGKIDLEGLEGKYRCWVYPSQHGWITMKEALKYSCDIYFFELIRKFDILQFLDFAKQYGGMSNLTGIDLPYEESGQLGSPDWKKKYIGYEWFEGDSMNLGIGQGFLTVTPIQMLNMYANIASDGKTATPHFFYKTKGRITFSKSFRAGEKQSIKQQFYRFVRQSLHEVTLSGGTAPLLNNNQIPIAAKTGTAEDAPDNTGKPTQDLWLTGFAPYDKPEIAALVMFEKSKLEFGGDLSPILKEAILFYFENKKLPQE